MSIRFMQSLEVAGNLFKEAVALRPSQRFLKKLKYTETCLLQVPSSLVGRPPPAPARNRRVMPSPPATGENFYYGEVLRPWS
jgi:hypothetical protein